MVGDLQKNFKETLNPKRNSFLPSLFSILYINTIEKMYFLFF